MKVTPNLIDELEEMSQLCLDSQQKMKVASEIEQMLSFIDEVKNVDVDDSFVTKDIKIDDFAREDVVGKSVSSKVATMNCKNANDDYFIVPKVVD